MLAFLFGVGEGKTVTHTKEDEGHGVEFFKSIF